MRILSTIILTLLAALCVTAAVFLAVDGNIARLTGWYHFKPGMPLFSEENTAQLKDVSWMRIESLHDRIECTRKKDGTWWITKPFHDRMKQEAAQAILGFTGTAKVVDTLPLNKVTRGSMREFGVETAPHKITLKVPAGDGSHSTIARYTLGSVSPWFADAEDGENLLPTTYLRTDFYGRDKRIHVVTGNILSLFRNGLAALRDPHPLLFTPDQVRKLTITSAQAENAKPLVVQRASAESPWNITSPNLTGAGQDRVNNLVADLASIEALRVDDAGAVQLPDKPMFVIELTMEKQGKPTVLKLYAPFAPESGEQMLSYATVDDRPVVFTLQAEPKVRRKGSYAAIVNSICQLPVLPEKAMAQILSGAGTVYTSELPLSLEKLRTMQFTDIKADDIERVALRSRFAPWPLRILRIPGDAESEVADTWMYSAAGHGYKEAEKDVVERLLKSLSGVPVAGFVEDIAPGDDVNAAMARYGLNAPDYVLSVLPRPCAVRTTLFGQDLPIVRDRAPRTYLIKRNADPATGRGHWVGMEMGTSSIYQLSTKLTRNFSMSSENWKNRSILHFPISALRKLTLGFSTAPLELEYDYIGETWAGKLKGEDVTPRINPHRAENYIRQLQKLKAFQWLYEGEPNATQALANPVFYVKLDLEMTDYSDAEAVIIEQPTDVDQVSLDDVDGSRRKLAETMLSEEDDVAKTMRDVAMAERKTHKQSITIEIAPADNRSDKPIFYGRIRETGALFTLQFNDAQSLAGSILDM